MDNKGLVFSVSFLASTLLFAEVAESADWQRRSEYPMHSAFSATSLPAMPDNPHLDTEAEAEFANVSNPYFASGGQYVTGHYVLNLKPYTSENSERQSALLWVYAVGVPDGLSGAQCMFAPFQSVDDLLSALVDKLSLAPAQIASIRRDVSRGVTQISGSHPGVQFFLSAWYVVPPT